jgi:hypothetical protein
MIEVIISGIHESNGRRVLRRILHDGLSCRALLIVDVLNRCILGEHGNGEDTCRAGRIRLKASQGKAASVGFTMRVILSGVDIEACRPNPCECPTTVGIMTGTDASCHKTCLGSVYVCNVLDVLELRDKGIEGRPWSVRTCGDVEAVGTSEVYLESIVSGYCAIWRYVRDPRTVRTTQYKVVVE